MHFHIFQGITFVLGKPIIIYNEYISFISILYQHPSQGNCKISGLIMKNFNCVHNQQHNNIYTQVINFEA